MGRTPEVIRCKLAPHRAPEGSDRLTCYPWNSCSAAVVFHSQPLERTNVQNSASMSSQTQSDRLACSQALVCVGTRWTGKIPCSYHEGPLLCTSASQHKSLLESTETPHNSLWGATADNAHVLHTQAPARFQCARSLASWQRGAGGAYPGVEPLEGVLVRREAAAGERQARSRHLPRLLLLIDLRRQHASASGKGLRV